MTRYVAILVCSIQVSAFCGPPPEGATDIDRKDYRDGALAASGDLAKGMVKYEIVGLPGPHAQDLAREAKHQYGVDVVFHGCIPSPRVWYDQGYLDMVTQHLKQRYGFDPVAQLDKELLEKYHSAH